MIEIGKYSSLPVLRKVEFGYYLDGGPLGDILLPNNTAPEGLQTEDELNVFIYCDSDDRLIATTATPLALADSFACLTVKEVSSIGAFLDWGLPKDLLVPFREQAEKMIAGQDYVVRVYVDEQSDRLVATSRLGRFLQDKNEDLEVGQEVSVLIVRRTDLGWKAVVDDKYWGMLFHSELFQKLRPGDRLEGFVKNIREDLKLDISLQKQGYQHIESSAAMILQQLKIAGGFLPLNDKSSPEKIREQMQMSKKAFKKAIGNLYRQRLIALEEKGIRLL
ncbi:MAG: S1-like domain-containing RNA-binding protein [Bacteroidota bacterium]